MTFGEMQTDVLRKIAESSSDPAFFSLTDVKRALNNANETMGEATEWREITVGIPLRGRASYYDLRGFGDSPILSVLAIFAPTPVRWLIPVSTRDLDNSRDGVFQFPQWDTIQAEVRHFFLRSLWWLGLYPRPSSDSGIVRLNCSSLPLPLINDEDSPDFPEEFHPGLVEYALYELFLDDHEVALGFQHWDKYLEHEGALRLYVQSRQDIDRVVGLTEEMPID